MSLTSLSRYDDMEDEIKDEDHGLQPKQKKTEEENQDEQENKTSSKDESSGQQDSASDGNSRPPSILGSNLKGLVSYGGEDSDDDTDSDNEKEENNDTPLTKTLSSNVASVENSLSSAGSNSPSNSMSETGEQIESTTKEIIDTVRLPPEPEGRCSKSLQEKVIRMIEKKNSGLDVNEYLQRKKEFRNPSIYEKLVSFIGIQEHGTNFPRKLYDPTIWGPDSHYDNLAKLQKEYQDKKEKEKLKRTHVDFVSGVKKTESSSSSATEKKSKWDQRVAPATGK